MSFTIQVNNKPVEVHEGEILLNALRRNGIKIPTLCYMHGFTPSGACRLCVVEVEGKRDLVTSCAYPVEPEMVVKTNSARVIKARKSLVEMLLSNHPDDCLYCERNGNCELQWLAEEMNIKERKYFSSKRTDKRDHSSPSVSRDPAKCILCSRCVRVCEEVQLVTAIEFISRADKTTVNSAFSKGLNISSCINCGQCIMVCPTGALVDISHIEKVQSAITSDKKYPVAFLSPAFVASVTDHFNLKPSDKPAGLIIAALKSMGFRKVYDLGWAVDMNIHLEASLLLERSKKKDTVTPLFSSCCPAWIKYAEEFVPEMISDISSVKSPQQLMGYTVKNHERSEAEKKKQQLYTVSLMACVANKFEGSREENTRKGESEVDATLTVREFLKMLRSYGINLLRLDPVTADDPFNQSSAAGYQVSYSGGKAESVAMHLNHLINGDKKTGAKFTPPKNPGSKKEVKITIGKQEFGFAWVSGIAEAQKYFDQLSAEKRKDIHYVEVMACPGGCAGGGGQPVYHYHDKHKTRKKTSQDLEKSIKSKKPSQNINMMEYLNVRMAHEEEKEVLLTRFKQRDIIK
ncbi:MAG: [Fe-Fe] hydrogenase large subunit C-terminal domain-containing protein [Bacteroidales bacterium]